MEEALVIDHLKGREVAVPNLQQNQPREQNLRLASAAKKKVLGQDLLP